MIEAITAKLFLALMPFYFRQLSMTPPQVAAAPPPASGMQYVAEDGITGYVAEDGVTQYVVEA